MGSGAAISIFAVLLLGWVPAAPRVDRSIPVRIEVQGPADCSAGVALMAGIQERLARVREAQGTVEGILLKVRLARVARRIRGELQVVDETGATDRRRVEGATCQEVVQALSFTAVLALEATLGISPSGEDEEPPSGPKPISDRSSETASTLATMPPARTKDIPKQPATERPGEAVIAPVFIPGSWRPEVGISTAVGQVTSPGISLGGALFGRLRWRRGATSGGAVGLAWRSLLSDVGKAAPGVRVVSHGLSLSGCPVVWAVSERWRIEPCVEGAVTIITAEGRTLDHSNPVTRLGWSVGGITRGAFSLGGRFLFEMEAGLSFPLVHRSYSIGTASEMGTTQAPLSDRKVAEIPWIALSTSLSLAYGW